MANKEYKIVLTNLTDGSGGNSPISNDNNQTSTEEAKSGGFLSKSQAKAFMGGMVAYHQVKSFATQIVSHEISVISLKTGQNELQQRAQLYENVGMRLLGAGESILVGAAVGGLAGAVAGLTLSMAHTAIDLMQKQQDIDLKRQLQSVALHANIIRAGGSRRNV